MKNSMGINMQKKNYLETLENNNKIKHDNYISIINVTVTALAKPQLPVPV